MGPLATRLLLLHSIAIACLSSRAAIPSSSRPPVPPRLPRRRASFSSHPKQQQQQQQQQEVGQSATVGGGGFRGAASDGAVCGVVGGGSPVRRRPVVLGSARRRLSGGSPLLPSLALPPSIFGSPLLRWEQTASRAPSGAVGGGDFGGLPEARRCLLSLDLGVGSPAVLGGGRRGGRHLRHPWGEARRTPPSFLGALLLCSSIPKSPFLLVSLACLINHPKI
ncbi:uncharacterized protein LOC127755796 [Oryza glaberrima]|uniref:uncharacterized protein LOC127755796 n=1 Tax=Oryza glaberrima TaxID=4538 RepID=UPI00224BE9D6|nr:uncharacterized protein LOC127755796 [Oryza glaberrima]